MSEHTVPRVQANSSGTAATRPSAPTLEELMGRAASGDRAAFAEVYDATSSHAFGIALSVTQDRSQAQDVVQDSYLDIWRASATYDPHRGTASSWVLMMVHGRAVSHVRSTHVRANGAEKGAVARAPEPALATAEGKRVSSALRQVPAPHRKAVELAYFGGYTHAEIAQMTGLPPETAQSRIREGLIELREAMRAHRNGSPSLTTS